MVKLMALLKRRTGLSREEFESYYETHHAPLAVRIAAMGHDYRRNYIRTVRKGGVEIDESPPFDVITEVWFTDRAAYEAFSASMQDPKIREEIIADEERFLNRKESQIFIVDENISPVRAEKR